MKMKVKSILLSTKPVNWFAFSLLAGMGMMFSQPAFAQTETVRPLEGFQTLDGGSDIFSNSSGGRGMLDLIHRAQMGTIRNSSEFSLDQQTNINSEALDFRTRQRRELEMRRNVAPTGIAPDIVDPSVAPVESN